MHECELGTALEIWGRGGKGEGEGEGEEEEEEEGEGEEEEEGEAEREEEGEDTIHDQQQEERDEEAEKRNEESEVQDIEEEHCENNPDDPPIDFFTASSSSSDCPSWLSDEVSFADLEIKSLLEGSSSPLRSSFSSSASADEEAGRIKGKGFRQMIPHRKSMKKTSRISPTNTSNNTSSASINQHQHQ